MFFAKQFAEYRKDKGYEKGESQPFWLEPLENVFGAENPAHYIKFENQVHLDHTSFIDGFIPDTHVLIEQKDADIERLKSKIEQTAQGILDARALYPDCSLADLYDELTMPPELRKAHQENDKAVMQAYGFDVKTTTESYCVAELMKMYRELTK